jgi:hypothetical protein
MATLTKNSLYQDHPGARWMVPFLGVMIATILFIFAMLAYAHR